MTDASIHQHNFGNRELLDRIQAIRTHYCTGPCGQSSSVLATRSNVDQTLREVYQEIERLRAEVAQLKIEMDMLRASQPYRWLDEHAEKAIAVRIVGDTGDYQVINEPRFTGGDGDGRDAMT